MSPVDQYIHKSDTGHAIIHHTLFKLHVQVQVQMNIDEPLIPHPTCCVDLSSNFNLDIWTKDKEFMNFTEQGS